MAGVDKPEFAPLLPPGRHPMTVEDLRRLCVDPFETSAERPGLYDAVRGLLAHLGNLVGVCEVWVDGSFVTAKPEPDDVDLTVVIEGEVLDALGPEIDAALDGFMNKQFHPKLHIFHVVKQPLGHPDYPVLQDALGSWAQWWCVARGGWVKGMAIIRIGETDVGLRLLP